MKNMYQVYTADFKPRGKVEATNLKMAIFMAKDIVATPIVKSIDGKEEEALLKRTNRWSES